MATAQVQAEYAQEAREFAAEIAENGYQCSFGIHSAGENAWDAPAGYLEIGKASVFPSEWRADFGKDIRVDDRIFYVSPIIYIVVSEIIPLGIWRAGIDPYGGYGDFLRPRDTDAPNYTHMIGEDGRELEIVHVEEFNPGGNGAIYYEIQVR